MDLSLGRGRVNVQSTLQRSIGDIFPSSDGPAMSAEERGHPRSSDRLGLYVAVEIKGMRNICGVLSYELIKSSIKGCGFCHGNSLEQVRSNKIATTADC